MKLAYRLEGREGAPVLVLSGSIGTTSALWEPQLAAFAQSFRILRHDQPGHGASPVPTAPFTVAEIAGALLALLDELALERVSLCGLSLGGMVGMWLGANAPARIDRLALCCTGAKLGTPESWSERAALARAAGMGAVTELARERWFTPAFRDSESASRYLGELRRLPPEGYARCCEAVGAFDFRDELGRIDRPTLVLAGAHDPVAPATVVDELAGGIPGAETVVLPRAAHLANVEQPEAFAGAVLRHFDRVAA